MCSGCMGLSTILLGLQIRCLLLKFVIKGRKEESFPFYSLLCFTVGDCGIAKPCSDPAAQNAFNSPFVECGQNGEREIGFPQP